MSSSSRVSSRFDNIDCMIGMKEYPDKYFDLAIVDPPFFSGPNKKNYYKGGNQKAYNNYKEIKNWAAPNQEYFIELLRVSKNQIVWGINYYDVNYMGSGRIVWDKKNDIKGNPFSDCEIAYCSLINHVRVFRYLWCGFLQENQKNGREVKIHPTQKPVALYKWLLIKYAKQDNKILDTHVGSASSLIACEDMGFEYVGYELDEHYYEEAKKRLKNHRLELEPELKLRIQNGKRTLH